MFGKLEKLRKLPRSQRRLVLKAAPALIASVVSLKLFGLKRDSRESAPVPPEDSGVPIEHLLDDAALAIRRVSNGLGIGTCLSRSLALRKMLRKNGITTELRIGVDTGSGEFKAHAWLEFDGTPIGEEIDGRYQVFAALS